MRRHARDEVVKHIDLAELQRNCLRAGFTVVSEA